MKIDHWMIFSTFAEQRHFAYPSPETYSGCLINANMAAHAPDGLASFLLEKTKGLKYMIDPLTHAFQHDTSAVTNDEGEPKKSIKKIAEWYGDLVNSVVGKKPLFPKEILKDTALFEDFVQKCLIFQRSVISTAMDGCDAAKYLTELEKQDHKKPYGLIAPYFYMKESTYKDWLKVNTEAAKVASDNLQEGEDLYCEIVISQGVMLSKESRDAIISEYGKLDVKGFILWVDSLNEYEAESEELKSLLLLARGLRKGKSRTVLNLHGGFFSILASGKMGKESFTGVAHGPEFGEFRAVVPVGGGIPISRYYVPNLHSRYKYKDALRIFLSQKWLDSAKLFHENVCNCDECKSVLEGNPENFKLFGESTIKNIDRGNRIARMEFPTSQAKLRCLRHYLQKKKWEYELAAKELPEINANLDLGISQYESVLDPNELSHLHIWRLALAT